MSVVSVVDVEDGIGVRDDVVAGLVNSRVDCVEASSSLSILSLLGVSSSVDDAIVVESSPLVFSSALDSALPVEVSLSALLTQSLGNRRTVVKSEAPLLQKASMEFSGGTTCRHCLRQHIPESVGLIPQR